MESPLHYIREDLEEMKSKMLSDSRCKKNNSYDVDILTTIRNIRYLIRAYSGDRDISGYNIIIIPGIIVDVINSLSENIVAKKNEKLLRNIIRLYEALLTRDTMRSRIHIDKNLKLIESGNNPDLLPTFFFNKQIYDDLYNYFCQTIQKVNKEIEEKKRKLSEDKKRREMEDIAREESERWEREKREDNKQEERDRINKLKSIKTSSK